MYTQDLLTCRILPPQGASVAKSLREHPAPPTEARPAIPDLSPDLKRVSCQSDSSYFPVQAISFFTVCCETVSICWSFFWGYHTSFSCCEAVLLWCCPWLDSDGRLNRFDLDWLSLAHFIFTPESGRRETNTETQSIENSKWNDEQHPVVPLEILKIPITIGKPALRPMARPIGLNQSIKWIRIGIIDWIDLMCTVSAGDLLATPIVVWVTAY